MAHALIEQVMNGIAAGAIYVAVALGLVLLYGVLRILNFAHGALLMLGGYVCQFVFAYLVDSYVLAVLASVAALIAIGWVLERGVFAPLRDNLQNQVIASLGLVLILQNLVIILWGPTALRFHLAFAHAPVAIGNFQVPFQLLLIVGVVLAGVAVLFWFLRFTKFGIGIRATAQHPSAALIVGIDVDRVHKVAFAIAVGLAALAGALLGPAFLVFPQMGDLPLVKGLAAIVLGGLGSVWGAVIGGFAIGIVESVSTIFIPTDYRDAVAFVAIVAVLLLRPQGLFGIRTRYED